MASIASSATSVLIAHVGAQTRSIRLGSGGVMLPNHAPLLIAEQFGALAAMYPGRIDLGLGRAPGSDQNTMYALRRDPRSADTFPQDVIELQGYLTGNTRVPGVDAVPGKGSNVPLYILGSSLFGAGLAAALEAALALYRREFQPSEQLERPYAIAGVNVIAADTESTAREQLLGIRRVRAISLYGRGRPGQATAELTDEQADQLLAAGVGAQVDQMLTYAAVGTPAQVSDYLDGFIRHTEADEVIVVHQAPTIEGRLRSVTLLAEAMQAVPA
jgi:luciferase family oxidoreductase group 1